MDAIDRQTTLERLWLCSLSVGLIINSSMSTTGYSGVKGVVNIGHPKP